jgi:thioredoxin-like negative regulator of GroEL
MQESDKVASLLKDAEALIEEAQYSKASAIFGEIFEITPGHPAGLRLLAQCMLKVDQHDQALALLADSIDPNWPDVTTILQITEILKALDRNEEAGDLLFASVHANPASLELRAEANSALALLGRTDDIETLTHLDVNAAEAPEQASV